MTPESILVALNEYASELAGVLHRFTRDRSGIRIEQQDNYRLRTIVTEVIAPRARMTCITSLSQFSE